MNLLTEPVFRVELEGGSECLSLPQLLEALGENQVKSLLGLQRHQEDAFHIFLCYLAGAVLAREGQTEPRRNAQFWLDGIRRLTGLEDDCAWTLLVEDVTKPAFMQAPVPDKADFATFKPKAATPDALDILPTAKNHDVKSSKASNSSADSWVYALISLQTMSGFFGQGNYGIARMNGGFGSRAMVTLTYEKHPGGHWRHDVERLLTMRDGLIAGPWGYRPQGLVLLWTPAWDHKTSFCLHELDPFYLEIARAVRLVSTSGAILALGASTKASRIAASEIAGVLGDPWTPINLNDKKKGESALTVASTGLSPKLLRNLLFEDGFKAAPMQSLHAGQAGQDCRFSASVLVRGQGTTDGFHHISLPIPPDKARRWLRSGPELEGLAELSRTALNDAEEMQNRVLKPALIALLEGGPEKINFDKREINQWLTETIKQFSSAWASDFFPWLWRQAGQEDADLARLQWLQALRGKAKTVLDGAIARYPSRAGRQYRARVKAEGFFAGCLKKTFPQLQESPRDISQHG